MAEREGFEPSIRLCRILTFQASAFDHSATAPHALEAASPSVRGGRSQAIALACRVGQHRAMYPFLLALAAWQATPAAPFPPPSSPADAQPGDWRAIPDDELMVMTLAAGKRVVVRLAVRYAPEHVGNVRRLALAHWWDATTIYRVQDNWVTQWGGAPTDDEHKPLPAGIVTRPAAEFDLPPHREGNQKLAQLMHRPDAYSSSSGITADGWATASDGTAAWLTHCYATVGVARDALPDTGSGGELFVAIGGSARRLDRNYTIVGRVIDGMAALSGLPRSEAAMGFYATPGERLGIASVRLASDLPPAERPHYQYRAADNARFAAMIASRVAPKPPTVGLGGVDVCDVPLATRRMP